MHNPLYVHFTGWKTMKLIGRLLLYVLDRLLFSGDFRFIFLLQTR